MINQIIDIEVGDIIKEPDQKVLDFLFFLEKETSIRFDIPSLIGKNAIVTTELPLVAAFYLVNIKNNFLKMEIRYCPYEFCQKIVYANIIIENIRDRNLANAIGNQIRKAAPDIDVSIYNYPIIEFENIKNNFI